MLIRSQNKEALLNFEKLSEIVIVGKENKWCIAARDARAAYLMGRYSSSKKSIKVLDEIQVAYQEFMSVKNDDAWLGQEAVFQMPHDSEVEV